MDFINTIFDFIVDLYPNILYKYPIKFSKFFITKYILNEVDTCMKSFEDNYMHLHIDEIKEVYLQLMIYMYSEKNYNIDLLKHLNRFYGIKLLLDSDKLFQYQIFTLSFDNFTVYKYILYSTDKWYDILSLNENQFNSNHINASNSGYENEDENENENGGYSLDSSRANAIISGNTSLSVFTPDIDNGSELAPSLSNILDNDNNSINVLTNNSRDFGYMELDSVNLSLVNSDTTNCSDNSNTESQSLEGECIDNLYTFDKDKNIKISDEKECNDDVECNDDPDCDNVIVSNDKSISELEKSLSNEGGVSPTTSEIAVSSEERSLSDKTLELECCSDSNEDTGNEPNVAVANTNDSDGSRYESSGLISESNLYSTEESNNTRNNVHTECEGTFVEVYNKNTNVYTDYISIILILGGKWHLILFLDWMKFHGKLDSFSNDRSLKYAVWFGIYNSKFVCVDILKKYNFRDTYAYAYKFKYLDGYEHYKTVRVGKNNIYLKSALYDYLSLEQFKKKFKQIHCSQYKKTILGSDDPYNILSENFVQDWNADVLYYLDYPKKIILAAISELCLESNHLYCGSITKIQEQCRLICQRNKVCLMTQLFILNRKEKKNCLKKKCVDKMIAKYQFSKSNSVQSECVICFDALKNGCKITMLNCKHFLHNECLSEWRKEKNQCPYCRKDIYKIVNLLTDNFSI